MASSKVVSTNPDLPRDSSITTSLSSLLSDLHHHSMDDLFKFINNTTANSTNPTKDSASDEVWKEIVAGSTHALSHRPPDDPADAAHQPLGGMSLEDFIKVTSDREENVRGVLPPSVTVTVTPSFPLPLPDGSSSVIEPFGNNNNNNNGIALPSSASPSVSKGKRKAVEEPVDKATLQKQRRMIKNRESAARSRERKQAYTSELEALVLQLEKENKILLSEEAEKNKQRYKELMQYLIPVTEQPRPKRKA